MSQQNNTLLQQRINSLLCSQEERILKKLQLTKENTENILKLKNKFSKKRCFIVGSSPSLKQLDLTKLNNEYTFTVNRGYMLKKEGLEHSTFHVISDINTFKDTDSQFEMMEKFSKTLFCYGGMKSPVKMETYYFDFIQEQLSQNEKFQPDLTKSLIAYQSVIHFAIQIAYYLGFNEIYILGVDLDFAKNGGHAYKETAGEKEREKMASIINAQKMLEGIDKCGQWLKNNNIKLYNASPGGIVDCIPRIRYEELF